MAAVHRYEGTVNQVMGDGIMALFGAPIAHEDHAVRACYAALAMQDAIRRYSDGGAPRAWHRGADPGGPPLGGGGGAGHRQRSAHGLLRHRPDHASGRPHGTVRPPREHPADGRDLAAGGGVCPGHPLGSGAREGAGRPCGGVRAGRRRPGPHAPAGLGGAGADPLRGAAGGARGPAPGLGSRPRPGTAKWWPSSGTPGWAKPASSTSSPRRRRTQGWLVLESRSASYGQATPYLPVLDLLKAYFQLDDGDDGRHIREKLTGRLFALDPALGPTLPAFLALLEVSMEDPSWQALDPPQRRQRTMEALTRLFLRESQAQPLLLVFENLHWIDAETQACLDGLVERLPAARLFLLVNYRPEYRHGWDGHPSTRRSGSTRCRPRAPRACCRASWGTTPVWNR